MKLNPPPPVARATAAAERAIGGDDAAHVGLEQVCAHAGHVAHVVAHVISDDAGIPGIVLRYAGLHLANQVGSDIGGLGEDSTAHAREQGYGAGSEAETCHGADVAEDQVQDRHSQQPDAYYGDSHHGAAGKRHSQRRIQATHRGSGRAYVGADRHIHAHETGQTRADGPDQV